MYRFSIEPNKLKEEDRILIKSTNYKQYTGAFVGPYTYCWNLSVDNGIEFEASCGRLCYNLQIGNFNSIGNNLQLCFGKNHNIKTVSTGGVELFLKANNIEVDYAKGSSFNEKGNIVIQNDIWFGENVTIMPNVLIRNGAVIARNSHVVSDVPAYAVVGGNPARLIGYRYTKEQIEKLQKIQWWYWNTDKIMRYAEYFTEDIDRFCDRFYDEAEAEYESYIKNREQKKDTYFVFVDYYEEYCSFPYILESFLDMYSKEEEKELLLFIRDDCSVEKIEDALLDNLLNVVNDITMSPEILSSVEVRRGTFIEAKSCFLNCSHFITTRTYNTVYFTCLAEQLGIEIISGVDSKIQFVKRRNMHKINENEV